MASSAIAASCGGFLLAVLWMDLMFDVQVLGRSGEVPEPVLASIAAYYRRVTTTARPMGHLVGVAMLAALASVAIELTDPAHRGVAILSLLLCAGPVLLTLLQILPNAICLGARSGSALEQSALARSICKGHLACFAAMSVFTVLQLLVSAGVA
jgi:hypothetical protein